MYYFMSLSFVGPAFWVAMVLAVYLDQMFQKAFELQKHYRMPIVHLTPSALCLETVHLQTYRPFGSSHDIASTMSHLVYGKHDVHLSA